MDKPLTQLGLTTPVVAAPMAGGPSTPDLALAAARGGGLGFLAGGYKTPETLTSEITKVRASGLPFGVNLFAPNPIRIDESAYRQYANTLRPVADRYGVDLSRVALTEDDDRWQDKVDLLLADPVPVASFTFGIPDRTVIKALREAGTLVAQTVTSVAEARLAQEAGVDLLIVQSSAAGGHSGILTPDDTPPEVPLPRLLGEIGDATRMPLLAAGGLATPAAITAAIEAGAAAAVVGTVLLRCPESGTSPPHRAALADAGRRTTVTHAFTGRPARALSNEFTDRFSALAPSGYPALHHLTSPLRKAAAAAGDTEYLHLWAGTGYEHATAEPAERVLTSLASRL
jgi:NAD(P)H-dependent flavin oxidoreductase YrpB (nitropropane dioxygenase family)